MAYSPFMSMTFAFCSMTSMLSVTDSPMADSMSSSVTPSESVSTRLAAGLPSTSPRTLVAGMPAKRMRELSEAEVAWKLEGTRTYHDLTRRCLATLVEVQPLAEAEAVRPVLQAPQVKSLIATRRG